MIFKHFIKSVFKALNIDLTRNMRYDRYSERIIKHTLTSGSNCIDIGCHKGEILELMLSAAPHGRHYSFEPIPALYENLKINFAHRATIFNTAVSNYTGHASFQYVVNAPAYSGLKRRSYSVSDPNIQEINVAVDLLDHLIPAGTPIDFIKIDVEGGELGVLQGARRILKENSVVILFECGLGASEFYNTRPEDVYQLLVNELGYSIYTLHHYLSSPRISLSEVKFKEHYELNKEYYFVSAKTTK